VDNILNNTDEPVERRAVQLARHQEKMLGLVSWMHALQ